MNWFFGLSLLTIAIFLMVKINYFSILKGSLLRKKVEEEHENKLDF